MERGQVQVKGIDIHTYFVKDFERAAAFYREKLGFKSVPGKQAEFELPDGSAFGLYQPQTGDGIEDWHKCFGIMFAVDDAAAAVHALRERGVTISDPAETAVCFMAFGLDSEGNQFIIHERK